MELSESQSPSLTSTAQNSSELSGKQAETQEHQRQRSSLNISNTDDMQKIEEGALLSTASEPTVEFLFRKCSGIIGVPISFLDKYCPDQFEIIDCTHTTNPQLLSHNHELSYYKDFKRGKVVTNADASMPLMETDVCGGTKCIRKSDGKVIYQLYHRLFVRKLQT